MKIFKYYGGLIFAGLTGYLLNKAALDIYRNIVIIILIIIAIIILSCGEDDD